MEGRLHSSSSSSSVGLQQQQQRGGTQSQQNQLTLQQYSLIVGQQTGSCLSSEDRADAPESSSPDVLVNPSAILKEDFHDSTFGSQYEGSYSVERLLHQQASNVVDAKPTISPALLSAVDLVSSSQEPLQALYQRQQEQLAIAQHHLALSASTPLLSPARTALLRQHADSPSAGARISFQPLLNTPPPPAVVSPAQLQQHQRTASGAGLGTPLPQLNSFVKSIDPDIPGVLVSSRIACGDASRKEQRFLADPNHQFRGQQPPVAVISPESFPPSPSPGSCSGAEHQTVPAELAAAGEEGGLSYTVRPVSPLRGRGRPSANPVLDGSPRQHPCPECGKTFPNNSALVKHRLIHSDERNFVCSICQKAFKRQDHLNGHLNVHKTVKPFPCIIGNCDKSYCDARSLRRHLEHSHNVQNPVVHSSKGTVYIKCDDLEATVLPSRGGVEEAQPGFSLVETSSGSTAPGQEYSSDPDTYGALGESPVGEQPQHGLISPASEGRRPSSKPVECAQCGRTFKNMPALNGHMRLHSSVGGKTETVPKQLDALPVFATPPVGGACHSGQSSSATGSTPVTGTSPVDSAMRRSHHQPALGQEQCLSACASAASSPSYHHQLQHQAEGERRGDCDYGLGQGYHLNMPEAGLLPYAVPPQPVPLHHPQPHHGYHVSDAQVQTAYDYTSPMSSRPPSHCSAHTAGQSCLPADAKRQDSQHSRQQPHQHGHSYAGLLTVNTSALQEGSGGSESLLNSSNDPTMMSPHLAALSGLDVSASPDLAFRASSGVAGAVTSAVLPAGSMVPMLSESSIAGSPYGRVGDIDAAGQRSVCVDFGFPGTYSGNEMASSVTTADSLGMQDASGHAPASMHAASSGGGACQLDGVPLDLGPELSKDVDDELIQKELLSFMRFPSAGDGIFNPFLNDDDEMLFSAPAKLTERKRHMTAPSALAPGAGGYSAAGVQFTSSLAQVGHHHFYSYHQQQSSSSSFSGYASPKPPSMMNAYEQPMEGDAAMNAACGGEEQAPLDPFLDSSSAGGGDRTNAAGGRGGGGHCGGASTNGNGKKSRPASRQRRKSRGKPDNVFNILLKSVGLRRSFNLPVSPPRFRKHSAAVVETSRKFSVGSAAGHRGAASLTNKSHHRSGGSVSQRHANRPKPAPLLIPRASLNRFHSQLRSPRLWIGGGGGLSNCMEYAKSGYSTPTPYTPPPILSPVRHGSGLFWTISKALAALAGPKSAPISPRFGRGFWPKALPPAPLPPDVQAGAAATTAAGAGAKSSDCGIPDGQFSGNAINNNVRVVSPLQFHGAEEGDEQPPATDTTPHINIGAHYQAEIPEMQSDRSELKDESDRADLLYCPRVCEHLDDAEVDAFCRAASGVLAVGAGRNAEYAMHLLAAAGGDLERAYFALVSPDSGRSVVSCALSESLSGYEYVDTCIWSCEEIMKFQEAIIRHDKDFYLISAAVSTKNVKQCIQFYYTWKKMCTDEYKRLRAARRRRILPAVALEPNIYDLRSLGPIETVVPSAAVGSPFAAAQSDRPETTGPGAANNAGGVERRGPAYNDAMDDFVIPSALGSFNKGHYDNETDTLVQRYNQSPFRDSPATDTGSTSDAVFPCRLCGKVFYKVKSRNAHMKSHSTGGAKKASPAPATTSTGLPH